MEDPCAKLIIIYGGAGFGKTSLVRSFLANRKLPFLWYQLDKEDGDIHLFMKYLDVGLKKLSENKQYFEIDGRKELNEYKALHHFELAEDYTSLSSVLMEIIPHMIKQGEYLKVGNIGTVLFFTNAPLFPSK